MISKDIIEKSLRDFAYFFSQYIIIVFNRKRKVDYLNKHTCKEIFIHVTIFIGVITTIVHSIANIYSINKPLPIKFLPIYVLIFSFIYLLVNFFIYPFKLLKNRILYNIKHIIFSCLLLVSFYCSIIIILYSVFIIFETYFFYYIMIALMILSNLHFIPFRYIFRLRGSIKIAMIIRLFIAIFFIYSNFSLIFQNQFSFIYRGRTYIYTFDPIQQEFLDSLNERNIILSYINNNLALANSFIRDVIVNGRFDLYELLIVQNNAIIEKESSLRNIYENTIFEKNRVILREMIHFIENTILIRNELSRLQFVGGYNLRESILNIEKDIQQLENDMNELSTILSIITNDTEGQNIIEIDESRIGEMRETISLIQERQIINDYLIAQTRVNRLVISEINRLIELNNGILARINNEMENEMKRMVIK